MIRLLQIVFIWMPAILALLPAYAVVRLRLEWQADCAGGRAANPGYHVADCWDNERATLILAVIAALLILPAISFGLLRRLARRKAGSGPDQP
ncbi:hypothetical protein [Nioella sediminis]|uniref:hypothetical protein n=1 Tax=Nioella sediminis TaxID=1912092 RepID=UPI0008FD6FEC|nr:hypothetical protein [Nioella sediminis]TBX24719.1 hypothetical protein TK43_10885 [Roseovarius sp. JS7-11]